MADDTTNSGAGTNTAGAAASTAGESGGGSGGMGGGGMAGGLGEMSDRMKQGGERLAQGGQDFGLRLLDQAETNAREAFNAMRQAAQAKDLSEIMRIQGDYLREASSRSVSQAREIGELIASFGRETMGQFTGRKGG